MADKIFIYLIVALNTACQLTLIWRLKFPPFEKKKFCVIALAIPLLLMVTMRLLIAGGVIHGRVADQSPMEHLITMAASIMLVAGPWGVTIAAIFSRKRQRAVIKIPFAE
jgi:hypothetical protein